MSQVHTHYDNLKVARDAPPSVIRAAYRALSQQWHPDKSPLPNSERIMVLINRSYAVLSDPDQRRAHDAWILEQEAVAKQEAQARQTHPEQDEPLREEAVHPADQSSKRRTGIPARLWVLIAVSVSCLAWINSDKLFADDQAARIAIQIPTKDAGIQTTAFTPPDTAELPVETPAPRNGPAGKRAVQSSSQPALKQASVDSGSVDADAIMSVEVMDAEKKPDAAPSELVEPATQRYVIQVAAVATQAKVDELQGRLRAAGVSSYTESSAELIRVRVGPYNKDEGEKMRSKLIGMGLSGTMVPL